MKQLVFQNAPVQASLAFKFILIKRSFDDIAVLRLKDMEGRSKKHLDSIGVHCMSSKPFFSTCAAPVLTGSCYLTIPLGSPFSHPPAPLRLTLPHTAAQSPIISRPTCAAPSLDPNRLLLFFFFSALLVSSDQILKRRLEEGNVLLMAVNIK